jgi:chemotaxis protein methyltransferase CheR
MDTRIVDTEYGSEEDFLELQDRIIKDTGWDCRRFKSAYLKRRLAVRMRSLGIKSYRVYREILEKDPEEYVRLKDRLTVNVTGFFRDIEVYDFLKEQILPEILSRQREVWKATGEKGIFNPQIKIWSAGCSTGEEPYTLAMLLTDFMEMNCPHYSIRIVATDLDQYCLSRAAEGVYPRASAAQMLEDYVNRFFLKINDQLKVRDEIRKKVVFKQHNLFSDPPLEEMDMVVCRNVMIYFSKDLQQRLFQSFYKALVPRGYYVLGKTETLLGPARRLFACISTKERIFQRILKT